MTEASSPPQGQPQIVPSVADQQAVSELLRAVEEYERAQQSEDVAGFLALFEEDAVWVTAGGRRIVGKPAIAEFTAAVLPGSTGDQVGHYRPVRIAFLRPDVAHVSLDQEYRTPEGSALEPPRRGMPSATWVRSEAGWRIAAGQNTPVAAPA